MSRYKNTPAYFCYFSPIIILRFASAHSLSSFFAPQIAGLPVFKTLNISSQMGLSFNDAKYGPNDHGDDSTK
uniref:Uncharacterized protein n=1 Tax=Uncultured archaeon GZfos26G2 TaxID=3386331 RepID=Q649D0_UNCAG|nr:hypothetical protein GZ35B7_30 [uncultured archaeon GZfos35B7]